jgi:internalin A
MLKFPRSLAIRPARRLRSLLGPLLFAGLGCLGCEESKDGQVAAKTGPSAGASLPTLAPAAVVAPKAEAEKKPKEDFSKIECKEGPDADFHDKGLEAEIRRKLEKPDGVIKKADLAKVKSVNLARDKEAKVDYLDPCIFPHLTQVKDLFLGPGELTDISLLSKLSKLVSLRASMNQVSDVSALKNLKNLDRLDLGHTQIVDVSALSGLTSLTELQLDNTKIKDVSPLAGLKNLVRLSLQRTEVKDIAPLKSLEKLKFLYIAGSMVEDPYTVARPGLQVSQE